MEISAQKNGEARILLISGFLDSSTAGDFEAALKAACSQTKDLTLNFAGVDFISSAGLRVLLLGQKTMSSVGGKMLIINANESVREVFELTGFSDILNLG